MTREADCCMKGEVETIPVGGLATQSFTSENTGGE